MYSVIENRIHWQQWAEAASFFVKDWSFRLRGLEAERRLEGESGRLDLAAMTALFDAIERIRAALHLMAGAAIDFDEIAAPRVRQSPPAEEATANGGEAANYLDRG